MSVQNIEKFCEVAANDGTVLEALTTGVETQAQLVDRAVTLASEQGLSFTTEEADAWIAKQAAMAERGELSDMQLQEVSGGKKKKNKKASGAAQIAVGAIIPIPGLLSGGVNNFAEGIQEEFDAQTADFNVDPSQLPKIG